MTARLMAGMDLQSGSPYVLELCMQRKHACSWESLSGSWPCEECMHAAKITPGAFCAAICVELAKPLEPFRPVSAAELGWKKYLPIRKMTVEEHERHLERKAKREENRYCACLLMEHQEAYVIKVMMLTRTTVYI